MIPICKEPPDWYKWLRVYEVCYFCKKETNTWHNRTNKPVCRGCAKTHKVSDLPKAVKGYKPLPKDKLIPA